MDIRQLLYSYVTGKYDEDLKRYRDMLNDTASEKEELTVEDVVEKAGWRLI